MWAQRQGSLDQSCEHEAMSFVGETAEQVAVAINDRCMTFCVRVAHVSYSTVVTPNRVQHYAIVVFEREPIRS